MEAYAILKNLTLLCNINIPGIQICFVFSKPISCKMRSKSTFISFSANEDSFFSLSNEIRASLKSTFVPFTVIPAQAGIQKKPCYY